MAIASAALAELWPSPVLGTASLSQTNSGTAAPGCSDVSWDTERDCTHSDTLSSLLPPLLNTCHCSPALLTGLCGYSFNLTSAYLWTRLLMAFSSPRHGRGWQSKWAQGLGASASKYCLHLEPDTKVTVMGTFPFVLVHFESGKLDTVEGKNVNGNVWKMCTYSLETPDLAMQSSASEGW